MKIFFEIGNRFAAKSSWIDFALTKFCLFSMGLMIGLIISEKHRLSVCIVAAIVCVSTYIPLMIKIFKTMKEMKNEKH